MAVEEVPLTGRSRTQLVAVVGIGGAGNNLLRQAITGGMSSKNCVAVNTDKNQLSQSPAENKVLLTDPNQADRHWSRKTSGQVDLMAHRVTPFTQEADFTILLAGLGGVTGTRTGPIIAQLNRSHVRPVVSVVALPFIHERERRFVAMRGLKRMVDSCDFTVVIDNAVHRRTSSDSGRAADETAAIAVRDLSDIAADPSTLSKQEILRILSLGPISTVCVAPVSSNGKVQNAVIDALRTPSANLPLKDAMGAVMLYRGAEPLGAGQVTQAYEAVASLAGHDVEFSHLSLRSTGRPFVSLFLSGYTYSHALNSFVDLIQHVYDMEFGESYARAEINLPLRLYQMESV